MTANDNRGPVLTVTDLCVRWKCTRKTVLEELSIELLKSWLARYKFKDWNVTRTSGTTVTTQMKEQRADEIARMLSDNTRWHSHGRGISRTTLEDDSTNGLNVRIDRLEDRPELARAARAYHDCAVDNLVRISRLVHVHTRSYT